jgi:hypothetical protein
MHLSDINDSAAAQAVHPFAPIAILPDPEPDNFIILNPARVSGSIKGSMQGPLSLEFVERFFEIFPSRLMPDADSWTADDGLALAKAIDDGDEKRLQKFALRIKAAIDDELPPADLSAAAAPEIVGIVKKGGPLTKSLCLDGNGRLKSDASSCLMSCGEAWRLDVADVDRFARIISSLRQEQAIALGSLRPGLPGKVDIVSRRSLNGGGAPPNTITRTANNFIFKTDARGFVLLDFDTKGMPGDVAERLEREGGFWPALLTVMPEFSCVAHITRASTSAGLFRTDTGATIPGSNGLHVYLAVEDSADSARFLKALHERCWLFGYGWMMVGAGGQLLERSIVDRMVGSPERLVFEGPPILIDPLAQSAEARRPSIVDGRWLDTLTTCAPLTIVEQARLQELRRKFGHHLSGDAAKAREQFIEQQAEALATRTGISQHAAIETIRKQCRGLLLPTIALPFDDPELAGKTVANVLADPSAFEGETLADPLEGIEYGRCKARIMRNADGSPWIHSFAHGRTTYEIKFDAAAIRAALEKVDAADVARTLVDMLLNGDIGPVEEDELVHYAKKRTGIGIRAIQKQIKEARQDKAAKEAREGFERRLAERDDSRPMLPAPPPNAPWLPQMNAINSVLGQSRAAIPPARTIDGEASCIQQKRIPGMHAFVSANEDSDATKQATSQCVIHAMSVDETAEMIEHHIDYVNREGWSVHLAYPFVRHYQRRPNDDALPFMVAVANLPIVSADGQLIVTSGLDRERGIVFNVDPALMEFLPDRKTCDSCAVGEAMRFLLKDWIADVATDITGKCTLIALALTLIERSLLDKRPVFWVIAGLRGSGKTTALQMILTAVTGVEASAAAWSPNEEERRKALHSYLMAGVPYILWDNIPRGAQISCPHIERSCTTAWYDDRKLGVSETVRTAAATIHCFTGNNIAPKGDLASRSLQVRLDVDRVDPENREFKHPDPIEWTRAHRAEILRALFVVLLGNPKLNEPREAPMKTRFKLWWRIIGAAVEHAAQCEAATDPDRGEIPDQVLDFGSLFINQDSEDEDATSLWEMLEAMHCAMNAYARSVGRQVNDFKASDVAYVLNKMTGNENVPIIRSFLFPDREPSSPVSSKSVSKQLRKYVDTPVKQEKRILVLRAESDPHDEVLRFQVEELGLKPY